MSYDALFEPISIGDMELKNRLAVAPMNVGYASPDGYPNDQYLAHYATRARGGFGLIITTAAMVNPYDWNGCEKMNPLKFTELVFIAGGSCRAVLELAGVHDVLAKSLGSNNKLNVTKATMAALESLRSREEALAARGK